MRLEDHLTIWVFLQLVLVCKIITLQRFNSSKIDLENLKFIIWATRIPLTLLYHVFWPSYDTRSVAYPYLNYLSCRHQKLLAFFYTFYKAVFLLLHVLSTLQMSLILRRSYSLPEWNLISIRLLKAGFWVINRINSAPVPCSHKERLIFLPV